MKAFIPESNYREAEDDGKNRSMLAWKMCLKLIKGQQSQDDKSYY